MTAREKQSRAAIYLSRYNTARDEADDIEKRIERVREEMMSVKAVSFDNADMPKAQNHITDLSDYIVRIDNLLREWQDARHRALALMAEISAAINAVEHDQARRVLMLHFIDGMEYKDVAKEIPCGEATVYRLRRIGLMSVKIKS